MNSYRALPRESSTCCTSTLPTSTPGTTPSSGPRRTPLPAWPTYAIPTGHPGCWPTIRAARASGCVPVRACEGTRRTEPRPSRAPAASASATARLCTPKRHVRTAASSGPRSRRAVAPPYPAPPAAQEQPLDPASRVTAQAAIACTRPGATMTPPATRTRIRCQEIPDNRKAQAGRRERRVLGLRPARHPRLQPPRRGWRHRRHQRHDPARRRPRPGHPRRHHRAARPRLQLG